jgi:hypothetical protein
MCYDASWRLIEEHIDDDFDPGSGGTSAGHSDDRIAQNLWGIRYIDDAVMRRIDRVSEGDPGTYEGGWYYLTDVQFSVVALIRADAVVEEGVEYEPYGKALYHDPTNFTGDGKRHLWDFDSELHEVSIPSMPDGILYLARQWPPQVDRAISSRGISASITRQQGVLCCDKLANNTETSFCAHTKKISVN